MPQLTVRDLSEDLVRALKIQAASNGRSVEAEHRMILARALKTGESNFWSLAAGMRATLKPQRTNSAKLVREMRGSR